MSMDRCSKCDRLVDTDIDCDFYQIETMPMCSVCREKYIDENGKYINTSFNHNIINWMKSHEA